jgi:hypothetical protein
MKGYRSWLMLACALAAVSVTAFVLRSRLYHVAQELRRLHQARNGVTHTQGFDPDDAAPGIPPYLEDLNPSELLVDSNRVVVESVFRPWPLRYNVEWTLERKDSESRSWRLLYRDIFRTKPGYILTITDDP